MATLDEISRGRITLGIGAGTDGFDATVLGNAPWSRRERAERFDEFVPLLSTLLEHDATTSVGSYYSAVEARNLPGCVQKPRIPFYVAATGPPGDATALRQTRVPLGSRPGQPRQHRVPDRCGRWPDGCRTHRDKPEASRRATTERC